MLGIDWYIILIGAAITVWMVVFLYFTSKVLWWLFDWMSR